MWQHFLSGEGPSRGGAFSVILKLQTSRRFFSSSSIYWVSTEHASHSPRVRPSPCRHYHLVTASAATYPHTPPSPHTLLPRKYLHPFLVPPTSPWHVCSVLLDNWRQDNNIYLNILTYHLINIFVLLIQQIRKYNIKIWKYLIMSLVH